MEFVLLLVLAVGALLFVSWPAVRQAREELGALRLLWARGPVPEDVLRLAAERPSELGVVASRALRDGERLAARLSTGPFPTRLLAAEAWIETVDGTGSTFTSGRVEALAVEGLHMSGFTARCVELLAVVGTVGSVAALSELSGGVWPTGTNRAATDAIRRIQGRAAGAEAGQVSIAEASAGGVSLAFDDATGAGDLSVTDSPDRPRPTRQREGN